ncbi:hypothetical protein VNO77_36231 [Canavalia gladiata]|uniref:Uncharacterized protein n=1 Tax=Canavalia gladiata TaxID=3824 RepID=A0AAN9K8Z1_CANGL
MHRLSPRLLSATTTIPFCNHLQQSMIYPFEFISPTSHEATCTIRVLHNEGSQDEDSDLDGYSTPLPLFFLALLVNHGIWKKL